MANKTYTVRVPVGTPDIGSEAVAQWLEAYLASPRDLAHDPGAGERSLRLSLDKEKVEQSAHVADEPEATFLRRLLASNATLSPAQQQAPKDEPRPKSPILKGALKVQPDQARPLVQAFESGQSFLIRRAFRVPQAVQAAAFTEQERQELSALTCEALNRRAPRALVENGDLFALATKLFAVEFRTIEQVRKEAEHMRQQAATQKGLPQSGPAAQNESPASASVPASRARKEHPLAAMAPFGPAKPESPEGESLDSLPYPPGYIG